MATCFGQPATIIGVPGPTIEGTPGNDVIVGTNGNDKIYGNGGTDLVCGMDGNDFIQTKGGNDRIDGGAGDDSIVGGGGNDELIGGTNSPVGDTAVFYNSPAGVTVNLAEGTAIGDGTDRLTGFEGIYGSRHDDVLIGTPADEYFIPSDGNDTVRGGGGLDAVLFYTPSGVNVNLAKGIATGEGTDTLSQINAVVGTDANDTIVGDAGPNFLFGAAGTDVISGGGGNDLLVGDFQGEPPFGNDVLNGGTGDDMLVGVGGNDVLDGGPGLQDFAAYWYANGVDINLGKGTATGLGEGRDRLRKIEGIIGSPGDDHIIGGPGPDFLTGQAGDDTISGVGGDDFLDGGLGDDTTNGGNGRDYCVGAESRASCEITGFSLAGSRTGAAANLGEVDYGEHPICFNAAARTTSVAGRRKPRRRHVASATPPNRVVPPVHRKIVYPSGLPLGLDRVARLRRFVGSAAAADTVTWQPILYGYNPRSHRWRLLKRGPVLTSHISASGVTLWSTPSGASVSAVLAYVPSGRYAWKARMHFATGETRIDTLEPHVNYGTRARGLMQKSCQF